MRRADQVEGVLSSLRVGGGRITGARRAVVNALLATDGHLSAADISAVVQAAHPDVAPSTVYRTLDRLVELGAVEHVHPAHGAAFYHLVDDHHVHLVCDGCGRVTDVPAGLLRPAATALARDHAFDLDVGHVALTGRCHDCVAARAAGGAPSP